LAAVYDYWNDRVEIEQLIRETDCIDGSGTLAVQLGCHALRRGYEAILTTYNLHLFDPSWFDPQLGTVDKDRLAERLRLQLEAKRCRAGIDVKRLEVATQYYLQYLRLGGQIQMQQLDEHLIMSTLSEGVPILCGLSSTYLYQESRERPHAIDVEGCSSVADDIAGDPVGHFVVLHGYDCASGNVLIADPSHPNPISPTSNYMAPLSQVKSAILLGIVTYDANLLTLEPRSQSKRN